MSSHAGIRKISRKKIPLITALNTKTTDRTDIFRTSLTRVLQPKQMIDDATARINAPLTTWPKT